MAKPPRPVLSTKSTSVPRPKLSEDGSIHFSFKYLDLCQGGKFCIQQQAVEYFATILQRFKDVCGLQAASFRAGAMGGLRNHPIRFGNDASLTEPGFTCLNAQFRAEVEHAAYQFSITKSEHGRVHGFMIDNVFYVVWFDPHHALDDG